MVPHESLRRLLPCLLRQASPLGLGLQAQQQAVRAYLNGGAWELVGESTEVERETRRQARACCHAGCLPEAQGNPVHRQAGPAGPQRRLLYQSVGGRDRLRGGGHARRQLACAAHRCYHGPARTGGEPRQPFRQGPGPKAGRVPWCVGQPGHGHPGQRREGQGVSTRAMSLHRSSLPLSFHPWSTRSPTITGWASWTLLTFWPGWAGR